MAFTSNLKSLMPRKIAFQRKIKLLSGGYVKPEAFPNGEITVFPWDTNTDDWLAKRAKEGNQATLLFDLCAQLCDLNGCPLDHFLIGDVNTVLLVSRSIRFNNVIEYEVNCPQCGYQTLDKIKVPDELVKIGEKDQGYPGFDEVTLPDCKDIVQIRPLNVRDERVINDRDEVSRKSISDHIMHILAPIVTINGGRPENPDDAFRWFNAISPADAQFLENKENEFYPHLQTEIYHTCDRCRKQFMHELDFSREFFRGSLKPGKGVKVSDDVRPGGEQQRFGGNSQPNPGSVSGGNVGVEQGAVGANAG